MRYLTGEQTAMWAELVAGGDGAVATDGGTGERRVESARHPPYARKGDGARCLHGTAQHRLVSIVVPAAVEIVASSLL